MKHENFDRAVATVGLAGVAELFKVHIADAENWPEDVKKEWLRNYKRGLIRVEDCFPDAELKEAREKIKEW